MNNLIQLLSNDNFIICNKTVVKKLGLHEAVLLGELCNERDKCLAKDKLEDDYFSLTQATIEEHTTLTAKQQKYIIDKFENMGIINTKRIGIPAKKYYRINQNILVKVITELDTK